MEWQPILTNIGITGAGVGIFGYVLKRWVVANMAKDAADKGAVQVHKDLTKDLRIELRERDADWQERWDRREKEFLEFRLRVEREHRIFREVSRATVKDIRTLSEAGASTTPPERLETQILVTGMGPLDRD